MEYKTLKVSHQGPVALVSLDRPEALNAMNTDFWQEFPIALRQLDDSGEVRAVVITAEGKHFSAGMDLAVFAQAGDTLFGGEAGRQGEAMRRLVLRLQQCFSVLEEIRMPVLCAIQGGCIGGAVDLVCAADMRYCTEEAFFCIKETDLGMTADLGTLQRLPKLIAPGLVRELAYTARKMPAQEALQTGLVNRVFADRDAMLDGVMAIAQQIAARSPLAIAGTKQALLYARDHGVAESLQQMATWQAGMFQPTDLQKAMATAHGKSEPFEALHSAEPALFRRKTD